METQISVKRLGLEPTTFMTWIPVMGDITMCCNGWKMVLYVESISEVASHIESKYLICLYEFNKIMLIFNNFHPF